MWWEHGHQNHPRHHPLRRSMLILYITFTVFSDKRLCVSSLASRTMVQPFHALSTPDYLIQACSAHQELIDTNSWQTDNGYISIRCGQRRKSTTDLVCRVKISFMLTLTDGMFSFSQAAEITHRNNPVVSNNLSVFSKSLVRLYYKMPKLTFSYDLVCWINGPNPKIFSLHWGKHRLKLQILTLEKFEPESKCHFSW